MALARTSLEQWAILTAVVDSGGFAQAALSLHRSQSAVSYAIARLQEAVGLPLLAIEGRRAVLTPHGHTLLQRARGLLHEIAVLEGLADGLKTGWEAELKLVVDAAFPRAHLLNIVAELQTLCPHTQLQLSDAVLSGAEEAITDGAADVVVSSRLPSGVLGDWLVDIEFVAVAHPEHPLCALGRAVTDKDLARYTQVVVRDSGHKRPRDEGWLGAHQRCTVSSMEASLATVAAKLAYAWLPQALVEEPLRRGVLRLLPLDAGGIRHVPLYLVAVGAELAGPAARTAIECFQRHAPRSRAGAVSGAAQSADYRHSNS